MARRIYALVLAGCWHTAPVPAQRAAVPVAPLLKPTLGAHMFVPGRAWTYALTVEQTADGVTERNDQTIECTVASVVR